MLYKALKRTHVLKLKDLSRHLFLALRPLTLVHIFNALSLCIDVWAAFLGNWVALATFWFLMLWRFRVSSSSCGFRLSWAFLLHFLLGRLRCLFVLFTRTFFLWSRGLFLLRHRFDVSLFYLLGWLRDLVNLSLFIRILDGDLDLLHRRFCISVNLVWHLNSK